MRKPYQIGIGFIQKICQKTHFLWRFPLTLLFLGCIPVANIWKLVQSANQIQDAAVASTSVTVQSESTSQQADELAIEEQSDETTSLYQTVSNAYFSDALFIGDSRTEGLALYGTFTNADYFAGVGLSIFTVTEVMGGNPNVGENISLSEKLGQREYGKIYIMLGINELGTGTADTWARTYAEVLTQIRKAQPNAVIYLQSILPVSAEREDSEGSINNAAIQVRNVALQKLENPTQQIYYLDVAEAVTDADGCLKAAYTSDGIHLLGNSLYLWEEYLKQHAILLDNG